MTLAELKTEVRDASPEVREELFTLLGVLRRARDPERARVLAEKPDVRRFRASPVNGSA